jgi:cell division protein FtsN
MRQTFSEFHNRDEGLELVGEERDDEFPRPDRRLPMMLLTVFAMALFAGGLWFAYVQGTRHPAATAQGQAVPLIRADERPTKVKPDQPGGMTVPDQNVSLYNEKPGAPVERLLPAPEQPLPRSATASPPASQAPAPTVAPQPPAKAAVASKQAAPATSTPAGKASPIQIQLGSLRSPEAAREEWARLKRENPDLLGKLAAVAVRTDLGDKGIYYRVLAGSFGTPAAAEKLCSELKQRQLGCVLAR